MGGMVRVGHVGAAIGAGAALAAGWVVACAALPIPAWARVGFAVYPMVAPVLSASLLRVSTESFESIIDLMHPEGDEEE